MRSLDRYVTNGKDGIRFRPGKPKALTLNTDGYLTVHLSRDGMLKRIGVHRLVAEAFIPNPDMLSEVNHIDYDRTNNNVYNLEWVSHGDNVRYSIAGGRHYCTRDLVGKNNPNYGNDTLKRRFAEHPEEALKQGRPGKQNGRATPVTLFDINKEFISEFDYFGECAEYLIENGYTNAKLDCVRCKISERAKDGRLYAKHYYKIKQ